MSDEILGNPDFPAARNRLGIAARQRCLMLIDAAQLEENAVLQALYARDDSPVWSWLFEGTELSRHAEAGPVIVSTTLDSRFVQHAIANWAGTGLLLIVADEKADILIAGVRAALTGHLQTFGPTVLRAYDTRYLQVAGACQPERLQALIGKEATWLWSVDLSDRAVWNGYRNPASTQSVQGCYDRDFERMLGWVSGWSICARKVAVEGHSGLAQLTAFIAEQYRAGEHMPSESNRLDVLWQQYQQALKSPSQSSTGRAYQPA